MPAHLAILKAANLVVVSDLLVNLGVIPNYSASYFRFLCYQENSKMDIISEF